MITDCSVSLPSAVLPTSRCIRTLSVRVHASAGLWRPRHQSVPHMKVCVSIEKATSGQTGASCRRGPADEPESEVQEHTSKPFSAWSAWCCPVSCEPVSLFLVSGASDCMSLQTSQSMPMGRGYPASTSISLPTTRQYSLPLKKYEAPAKTKKYNWLFKRYKRNTIPTYA